MNKDSLGTDSGVDGEATGLAGPLASCVDVGWGVDWVETVELDSAGPD